MAIGTFATAFKTDAYPIESKHWQGSCKHSPHEPKSTMFNWTYIFSILAVITAVLGFSGLAGASVGIAHTLFALFLGLTIVSLFNEERRRRL